MCSLNDNDPDAELDVIIHNEDIDILDGLQCQKCCENKASIKLRGKDIYCRSCFQINVTHKFRVTLGKSKIVRPNDKILVAHSGNGKSTALLHLIKAGMHESVHKRLIFQTQVIYIDDGMITNQCIDERQSLINGMKQQVESLGFETFVVSLCESLDERHLEKIENIQDYLCTKNNANDEQLIDIFNNLTSDTSKEDLWKKLRLKVIVAAAKSLGCDKIFFADDSTSLSICILTNVSFGRGAHLSLDVGCIDDRYGDDLIIMRPLRDFSRHEVNYYLNIHNLEIVHSKKLISNTNFYGSIRKLTEHFVVDLDTQFNGTVSTIFRVSEKVTALGNNSVDNDGMCILCNAPLDTSSLNDDSSAIKATAFSKFVSCGSTENIDMNNINNCDNIGIEYSVQGSQVDNCCGACVKNDCMSEKKSDLSLENILLCLCYGCRLIFCNNNNLDLLPKFLITAAKEQLCFKTMRDQITNFLL